MSTKKFQDDADLLLAELEELKALLGDDYQHVHEPVPPQTISAALERAPRRAPKKRPHNKKKTDAVEEDVQDAQQPQESLLVRIHKAKERNEALTSVLKAQLAQVERQLVDSDHAATTIKQAQAIDRNMGRQAGGAQQFSWTVRHSEAARGCSRLMAATGEPAPPQSTFWAHSGKSPAPNETAKALTKLFWRNPAAARPPRTWHKLEEERLTTAVRSLNVANKRDTLVARFHEQVSAGADPEALKSELALELEALAAHGGMEEAETGDCEENAQADLHDARSFTIKDWQNVAQQVGDRRADECAVHYSAHIQPCFETPDSEQHRDLTAEEQKALLAAVKAHGRRSWPQVAASCGLPWQPWRLLQAFWQAAAAADAAQDALAHAQAFSAGTAAHRKQAGTDQPPVGEGNQAAQPSGGAEPRSVHEHRAHGSEQGTNGATANREGRNEENMTGLNASASRLNGAVTGKPRYWQWPEALDERLLKVMEDLVKCPWAVGDMISWTHVAFMVREGVTALQCKLRFWQLQHFERQAGPFTAQESGNVVAAVRQHGHDWAKVAKVVPGRTPKQCSDHFMTAAARPARDIKHLWTPEIKREFFRLRVQHSRGSRQMHWAGIASDLSELCAVRLSIEDVRKKSKALVRQLTAHGMPPGYSLAQQQEYVETFPQSIEARQDKVRASLHAWGAQNGINIRQNNTPPNTSAPALTLPAGGSNTTATASAAAAAGANTSSTAQVRRAPTACSTQADRMQRVSQLLQQTRYLRFLDEPGNEAASPDDNAEDTPTAQSQDNAAAARAPSGRSCLGGRAAEVLKGVSATQLPTAAALRALLLSSEYVTGTVADAVTPVAHAACGAASSAAQPNLTAPAQAPAQALNPPNLSASTHHMAAGSCAAGASATGGATPPNLAAPAPAPNPQIRACGGLNLVATTQQTAAGSCAAAASASAASCSPDLNRPLAQMPSAVHAAPSHGEGHSLASASLANTDAGCFSARAQSVASAATRALGAAAPQAQGGLQNGSGVERVETPNSAAGSGNPSQQPAATGDASISFHASENHENEEDRNANANGCTPPRAAAQTSTQSVQVLPDSENLTVPLLQGSQVAGMLGEGRWIQCVKVNHAQRRARIASLQSAKRLKVHLKMPALREEHGISQDGGQEQRPQSENRVTGRCRKNTRKGSATADATAEAPEEEAAAPKKRTRATSAQGAAEGSDVAAGKRKKQTHGTTGTRTSSRTALQLKT